MAGHAQTCLTNEATPALKLETRSGVGVSRVVGFEPFVNEGGPIVRYRQLASTGTVFQQWLTTSDCTPPTVRRNFSGGGTGTHVGRAVEGHGALTATDHVENGKRRYNVTASGSYSPTPNGGTGGWGYLLIETNGFGTLTRSNGVTVDLALDRVANVAVMVDTDLGGYPVATGLVAPGAPTLPSIRDEWNRVQEIDDTGQSTTTGSARRFLQDDGEFPLEEGGQEVSLPPDSPNDYPATTRTTTVTATSISMSFDTGICWGPDAGGFYAKYSGNAQLQLTERDDEDAALERARTEALQELSSASFSLAPKSAHRRSLDTNLDARAAIIDYRAFFQIACAGEYEITLTVHELPQGATVPRVREIVLRQHLESGFREVAGRLEAEEKNVDYTIVAAVIRSPCPDDDAGSGSVGLGSVDIELSLGRGLLGNSGGRLSLHSDIITESLYSPRRFGPRLSERRHGGTGALAGWCPSADVFRLQSGEHRPGRKRSRLFG